MIRKLELFDFNEEINPHGEDGVTFEYKSGNLQVDVLYNDKIDVVSFKFLNVMYQYLAPVPGYCPSSLSRDRISIDASSGCVFEISNSCFLKDTMKVFQNSKYKPDLRHFFVYLEWENISLHVISSDFEIVKFK